MHRFIEEFALTHQQIAEAVGKARATVTNLLRLMSLPRELWWWQTLGKGLHRASLLIR